MEIMESIGFEASIPSHSHNNSNWYAFPLLILLFALCFSGSATDTLTQNDTLTGNQTLISTGKRFEFGFFNLGSRYYLGIWYHDIQPRTVVWVANREEPFGNSSGFVGFRLGKLEVVGGMDTSSIWWSLDVGSDLGGINLTAKIMDNGNLVVSLQQDGTQIWGSFDSPTDTFLPEQMLILDSSKNDLTTLKSWKSDVDPSPGDYSLFLDPRKSSSYYQYLIVDSRKTQISANSTSIGDGDVIWWRSGPWSIDAKIFNGVSQISPMGVGGYNLVARDNGNRIEFSFTLQQSRFMRFVLLGNGTLMTYIFEDQEKQWVSIWSQPLNSCDSYNHCGKNAMCATGSEPRCQCLFGFKPSLASEWSKGNWSGGCIRNTTIEEGCQPSDVGFLNLTNVKTPDLQTFYRALNETSESFCRNYCLNNCTCTAYVFIKNDGCYTWSGALFDLLNLTTISMGNSLSIKLNESDLPQLASGDSGGNGAMVVAIVIPVIAVTIFTVFSIVICTRYTSKFKRVIDEKTIKKKSPSLIDSSTRWSISIHGEPSGNQQNSTELPLLDFEIIRSATNSFNETNALGKGGFGHVYKGVLPEGEVVAVKRLSFNSFQGLEEFKNEMMLIAKLQHKNLVRMHGVCIEGSEKILVYEYMPNKSLDDFIFNPEKQQLLDWRTRFGVIEGVARGLLYLHRDSRLPIVHRDLKAANILLDEEMNPKISDFGMARIFGGNENDQDNTNRVVGTFGYMSPEYAMEGLFSVKSDVYSFGVLILEIICGIKNNKHRTDEHLNLLGHAWQLWKEDRGMELVDPTIKSTCAEEEALRCEHVALLCVQDRSIDRPTMSDVVKMLGTELSIKQIPKKPAFIVGNRSGEAAAATHTSDRTYNIHGEISSENEITFSERIVR